MTNQPHVAVDLTALIEELAAGVAARLAGQPQKVVYSLDEIEAMTGIPATVLAGWLRAGQYECTVLENRKRGMTKAQLTAMLAARADQTPTAKGRDYLRPTDVRLAARVAAAAMPQARPRIAPGKRPAKSA